MTVETFTRRTMPPKNMVNSVRLFYRVMDLDQMRLMKRYIF
jgi:hypothetical protein